MKYTDWDADAVARAILGEASDQGYIGKVAVASVIANRAAANHRQFGSTPFEQVMAPSQFTSLNPRRGKNAYNLTTASRQSSQYQQALAIAEGVLSGLIPDPTGGATSYWAKGSENNSDASEATKTRIQGVLATGKVLQIGHHLFNQEPESLAHRPPANFQTLLAGSQSADQIDRLRDLQRSRLASSPEIEAQAAALPGNVAENKARLVDQAEALSEQAPDESTPQAAPVDPKLSTAWAIAATGMGRMSMTDALAFLRGQIIQEQLQSPGLSEDEAVQRIGRIG